MFVCIILEECGPQCIHDQVDMMVPGDLSWSLMLPERDDSLNACFVLTFFSHCVSRGTRMFGTG